MSTLRTIGLALTLTSAAACASASSGEPPSGTSVVYPVTDVRADRILHDAMAEELGVESLHRVSFPDPGYRAEIGPDVLLAVRIPAIGRSQTGGEVRGFVFRIDLESTPTETSSARLLAVTKRIGDLGARIAHPIPVIRTLK